jgi:nicotinamidase-related amidase
MAETNLFTLYLQTFEELLGKAGVVSHQLPLREKEPAHFDVFVIDMQNGFMASGECGVLDSDHLPVEIVRYLDYMGWIVEELNKKGCQITLRYIFSRDYHHPEHHSFMSEERPTGFPAHCQYGTNSSMIHPILLQWIEENKEKNILVTFKGYHPYIESYSALAYTEHYNASERQGTCCDAHRKEVDAKNPLTCGGGVVFPELPLEILLQPNPFTSVVELVDGETDPAVISQNAEKTLEYMTKNGKPLEHIFQPGYSHSFVVGLAGDFCVRDTLINTINQKATRDQDGESCLVYNLTAHVALLTDADGNVVGDAKDSKDFIWVSSISEMIQDYIEPERGVCVKTPIFMKYIINEENFPIDYFGGKKGHL